MEDNNPNPELISADSTEEQRDSYYKAKIVKLNPDMYEWPESIEPENVPDVKPTVRIRVAAVQEQVRGGATWEMLSNHYLVDTGTLKKHLSTIYTKARAELELEIMQGLLQSARDGSAPVQRFLGGSILKLIEKKAPLQIEEVKPLTIENIDDKLEKLLKKHGPKKGK